MAKDPANIVEVERQLTLLRKRNYSTTKRILLSTPALVFGLVVSLAAAVSSSWFYLGLGLIVLVMGGIGLTAAFYQPAAFARRIAYLEDLADSMEAESIEDNDPTKSGDVDATGGESRTCPYCAETIKAAALVCKHCGRDLPRTGVTGIKTRERAQLELRNPSKPENQYGLAALIAGIASWFLPIPFLVGGAAMVLGFIGDNKVNTFKATNKWMAVVGLWLGLLNFVAWLIIIFYFVIL